MKHWRRILLAAWLALAVPIGQQLVVLHALGHAADRIANKDSDAPASCKIHFACSQLASAVGAKPPPTLPVSTAVQEAPRARFLAAGAPPFFVFLSRGPPHLLG